MYTCLIHFYGKLSIYITSSYITKHNKFSSYVAFSD